MSDGFITGGEVRLLERVKTGDYEHKEAMVSLHFSVYEGQDHRDLLDRAKAEVISQVGQLLGRTHRDTMQARKEARRPPKIEVEVNAENTSAEEAAAAAAVKASDLPTNKAIVTTDDPAAKADVARLAQAALTVTAGVSGPSVDPLDMGDGDHASTVIEKTAITTAGVSQDTIAGDPLDMGEELTAAAPEVTDKLMNEQVQFHNNRLIEIYRKKNGDNGEEGTRVLREHIGKFVPVGKKVKDIPTDQRQNFVDGLKGLK